MEKVEGTDYFKDLESFAHKARLENPDIARIQAMARYLAGIHAVKASKTLYWKAAGYCWAWRMPHGCL
jgi:hypothetical protein